jgi:D-alanine transaminase
VPAYAGKLFRFEHHMARLDRSLAELRIANPMTHAEWRELALQLIASYAHSSGVDAEKCDQLIYIQVTRGVALRDHAMLPGLVPTVFVMINAMKLSSAEQRSLGVACVTADDFRWEKAHIKSTSLLGAVFARQISVDAGALETVMFRGDYLSEAAASNVWVVKNGAVMGPPKDRLVLEGIRYGLIEEMCRASGIGFELRRITRAEVLAADELLLSSATKEVLPVTLLDGQPVGNGKPGPIYARLYAAYQQAIRQQSR